MPEETRPRIRPVSARDRDAWLELRVELWPDQPRRDLEEEIRRALDGLAPWKLGRTPVPFTAFVAVDDRDRPIGFVEVSLRPYAEGCDSSPVGYLEGWFVASGHRRRGVGRRLVAAAEEWARVQGCTEMASDALADNVVSAESHRALGYAVTERDVHFRRSLAPESV